MTRDTLRTSLKNDGIDHINISPRGETELGRVLFLDWQRRFYIPGMGNFQTARSFANWMISGGDDEHRGGGVNSRYFRSTTPMVSVNMLMVFAKYYQLRTIRQTLEDNQDLLSLPWVGYRKYPTGVRESDRWSNYGSIIKPFVEELVDNGDAYHDWAAKDPDILEVVNHFLKGIAGDDFVPFEQSSEVVGHGSKPATDEQPAEESDPQRQGDQQSHPQGQSKQQRKKNKGPQKLILVGANTHKVNPPTPAEAAQQLPDPAEGQPLELVGDGAETATPEINSENSTVTNVTRLGSGGLLVEVRLADGEPNPEEAIEQVKAVVAEHNEQTLNPTKLNDLVSKFQP